MIICCVAIVGKHNNPLFLKVYQTIENEEPLKFHYIAHTALDVIDEKIASRKETTNSTDMYLGVLFPIEVYKMYVLCSLID